MRTQSNKRLKAKEVTNAEDDSKNRRFALLPSGVDASQLTNHFHPLFVQSTMSGAPIRTLQQIEAEADDITDQVFMLFAEEQSEGNNPRS